MNRERLIHEVKEEYQKLAETEKQEHFVDLSSDSVISPDRYYEFMLENVLGMIANGAFDKFSSGKDIVQAVTNNKTLLFEKWGQGLPEVAWK